jgi:hypothetical protein
LGNKTLIFKVVIYKHQKQFWHEIKHFYSTAVATKARMGNCSYMPNGALFEIAIW